MAIGKVKRVLLAVGIALGVIAVTGGIVALTAYHEATKIDRSRQDIVIGDYIHAMLTSHDPVKAELFTCARPKLNEFIEMASSLSRVDGDQGAMTHVTLRSTVLRPGGDTAEVILEFDHGSGLEVRTTQERWLFSLVNEDGWRVCGAEQLPDPSPTPSNTPTAIPPTAG